MMLHFSVVKFMPCANHVVATLEKVFKKTGNWRGKVNDVPAYKQVCF